ncbi:hypothetical protein BUALT_Bualt03G0045400 [Buddleja alternifolia]|uniref:Myb/SANT-like DNA-binding domain-containing protein n=1 Tax=Buddleja alternifolia TaxID=168488 RepID=A0AAV6XR78_9LAMI|nr:hypothetical protein BUALT_Bualt03G0045400 [Buddleja alternifolia]
MGDLTESSTPPAPPSRQVPFREDCWTEEATSTLVDAWGRRYLELNRGNLRQKDWQEVADAVNARHGHTKKTRRTDVQCKNRIDTLKKKYKIEKAKISESNGNLTSSWPFFPRLELLIGPNFNKHQGKVSPLAMTLASSQSTPPLSLPSPPMAVPLAYRKPLTSAVVTPVILPQKRPMPSPAVDESYFRRNYSAIAAAAAAAAAEDDAEEDDRDLEAEESEGSEDRAAEEEEDGEDGLKRLAKAIERFGEIYEKMENMKQRQVVELEKQRMQFAKDLEVQRMQLFMDTQVQLEKIKQAKRSGSSDVLQIVLSLSTTAYCFTVHCEELLDLECGRGWKMEELEMLTDYMQAELSIDLDTSGNSDDILVWKPKHTSDGQYICKSGYEVISNTQSHKEDCKHWHID